MQLTKIKSCVTHKTLLTSFLIDKKKDKETKRNKTKEINADDNVKIWFLLLTDDLHT
jgi:hypothetical protein